MCVSNVGIQTNLPTTNYCEIMLFCWELIFYGLVGQLNYLYE